MWYFLSGRVNFLLKSSIEYDVRKNKLLCYSAIENSICMVVVFFIWGRYFDVSLSSNKNVASYFCFLKYSAPENQFMKKKSPFNNRSWPWPLNTKGCTVKDLFVFCGSFRLPRLKFWNRGVKKLSWIVWECWHWLAQEHAHPLDWAVKVCWVFTWCNHLWRCCQIFMDRGIVSR